MPIKIERLTCRVTVKTGSRKSIQHTQVKAAAPSMKFAHHEAQPRMDVTLPEPSQLATEDIGREAKPKPSARTADVRAITDRVYELMTQEVALARMRAGKRTN